jgi:hypothetical protein
MFIKARTRRRPKFIGWSSPLTWWFKAQAFDLSRGDGPGNGPVFHIRAFCANWLLRPRHTKIKGWCALKADALQ